MKTLLRKELKLATSPLSWLFLLASGMTLLPGYPIELGAFFLCLGLFQSVQLAREANDVLYSALLPIPKRSVVTAKYLAAMMFQLIGLLVMVLLTLLRMLVLRDAAAYVNNALLPANLTYLGAVLWIFASYNILFLGGFFRTAYKFGLPFIAFGAAAFLIVLLCEVLPHFPGLTFLRAVDGPELLRQLPVAAAGLVVYVFGTLLSLKRSQKRFVKLDL